MKDFGVAFNSALQSGAISGARYALEVVWDTSNTSVFFSHESTGWTQGGRLFPGVLTGEISSTSQEIAPDNYRTTVGSLGCTLIDLSEVVTNELNERIQNFAYSKAQLRLYVNLTETYTKVATFNGDTFDYNRAKGTYRLKGRDTWSTAKEDAFRVRKTKLSSGLSADPIQSIAVVDSELFAYVDDVMLGGGPSHIRIQDEIILFAGISPGFITNINREEFGTEATSYEDDGMSERPDVSEVIAWFNTRVVDLICLILTGRELTGPPQWPVHWHLGFDRDTQIDIGSFQNIGEDIIDIRTRGVIQEPKQAKSYIESQCLPLIGCVILVNPDGTLRLRRLSNSLNSGAGSMVLNENNLRSIKNYGYKAQSVKNTFTINWNYPALEGDPTRIFTTLDSASIARYGSKEAKPLDLELLHGTIHTQDVLEAIISYQRERLVDPPIEVQVDGLSSLTRLDPGDLVQLQWAGMSDVAGNDTSQIDRTFEVRSVSVDWRSLRASLKLFGSTAEPPAISAFTPVLADSFYTSEGTPLPSVTNGELIGDIGLTAGTYYVDGDFLIPAGRSLSIAGTTQLRIKGTLTVEGTITGTGRGLSGGFRADRPSSIQDLSSEAARDIPAAVGGYVGTTRGSDAINGSVFATTSRVTRSGDRVAPVSEGRHTEAPFLVLTNQGGVSLSGLPANCVGIPGAAGQFARTRLLNATHRANDDEVIWTAGGDGGASAAGLILIVRGLVINPPGAIHLDGIDGSDAPADTQFTQTPLRGGGGAGGSGGACYVLFDGIGQATETGGYLITSRRGAPGAGSGSDLGLPSIEQRLAHVRFQTIPPAATPLPDPVQVVDFVATASTTLVLVSATNGLVDQVAYGADPVIIGARTVLGQDISNEATYSLNSVTGSATITVNSTTGLVGITQIGPDRVSVILGATIGTRAKFIGVTFMSVPTVVPVWRRIAVTGQSNAVGATATPILSTTVPNGLDAVRVNNGNNALEPAVATSLEDPTYGIAYTLAALTGERAIVNTTGISGAAYEDIKPGAIPETFSHKNLLDDSQAVENARLTQQVRTSLVVIHGETDQDQGNTNYEANLNEWLAETIVDLAAIHGPGATAAMFILQVSTTGMYTGGRLKLTLPQQQLAASVNHPGIHLVGPGYPRTYNDLVHFDAESNRLNGAQIAKVLARVDAGLGWEPLRPITTRGSSEPIDVNKVIIDYVVPVSPIVLDTVTFPAIKPGLGFDYEDAGAGPPVVRSVEVSGDSQVTLTLSDRPRLGGRITYAMHFDGFVAGHMDVRSAYGHLRDSDATDLGPHIPVPPEGHAPNAANWAVHSDEQITDIPEPAAGVWSPLNPSYASLDASNRLELADATAFGELTGLTIAFWYRHSAGAPATGDIFNQEFNIRLREVATSEQSRPQFFINTASAIFARDVPEFRDGVWHHWVIVVRLPTAGASIENVFDLWIDGRFVGTSNSGALFSPSRTQTTPLRIGVDKAADYSRFEVYDTALSETQVIDIYGSKSDRLIAPVPSVGAPLFWAPLDGPGSLDVIGSPTFTVV